MPCPPPMHADPIPLFRPRRLKKKEIKFLFPLPLQIFSQNLWQYILRVCVQMHKPIRINNVNLYLSS